MVANPEFPALRPRPFLVATFEFILQLSLVARSKCMSLHDPSDCWLIQNENVRILPRGCRQHDFHFQVSARLVEQRVSCRSGFTLKSPRCFSAPGCDTVCHGACPGCSFILTLCYLDVPP